MHWSYVFLALTHRNEALIFTPTALLFLHLHSFVVYKHPVWMGFIKSSMIGSLGSFFSPVWSIVLKWWGMSPWRTYWMYHAGRILFVLKSLHCSKLQIMSAHQVTAILSLTHWCREKMAAVLQTTFWKAFFWNMKNWKCMNFDFNFIEVCSLGSN